MATAERPTAPPPQDERPITRVELREELANALSHYVTRAELREELVYALQHYATKSDVAELEVRMIAMEARLIRWIVGMMVGGMAAAAAIASIVAAVIGN